MPRITRGGLALSAVVFLFAAVLVCGCHRFGGESDSISSASGDTRGTVGHVDATSLIGRSVLHPVAQQRNSSSSAGPDAPVAGGSANTAPVDISALTFSPDALSPAKPRLTLAQPQSAREQAGPVALVSIIAIVSVAVLLTRGI